LSRLLTFGGIDLRDEQGRELESVLRGPKQLALLVYLATATPRGFHRRDTLMALLWPELDQEHARRSLRYITCAMPSAREPS
jgi:DNA-binding SARP family transcriptional activator